MSPLFRQAFDITVLGVEGGFQLSTLDGDPGGSTFAGISRRFHPTWPGWGLLDVGEPWTSNLLQECVRQFYYREFWVPTGAENLPANIGQQVFDMAVHSDPRDSARCLQRALATVKVDGQIGPKTIAAVRSTDQMRLIMRFNAARIRHLTQPSLRRVWAKLGAGLANRVAQMLDNAAG